MIRKSLNFLKIKPKKFQKMQYCKYFTIIFQYSLPPPFRPSMLDVSRAS